MSTNDLVQTELLTIQMEVLPSRHNFFSKKIAAACAVLALSLSGCGDNNGGEVRAEIRSDTAVSTTDTTNAKSTPTTETTTTEAPVTTSPETTTTQQEVTTTTEATQPPDKISVDGFGPIRRGMTREQIQDLGYELGTETCGNSFVPIEGGPSPIIATFDDKGKLNAMGVSEPGFTTLSNIGVGDSYVEVAQAYGDNISYKTFEGNIGPVTAMVFESDQAIEAGVQLLFVLVDQEVKLIDLVPTGSEPLTC